MISCFLERILINKISSYKIKGRACYVFMEALHGVLGLHGELRYETTVLDGVCLAHRAPDSHSSLVYYDDALLSYAASLR